MVSIIKSPKLRTQPNAFLISICANGLVLSVCMILDTVCSCLLRLHGLDEDEGHSGGAGYQRYTVWIMPLQVCPVYYYKLQLLVYAYIYILSISAFTVFGRVLVASASKPQPTTSYVFYHLKEKNHPSNQICIVGATLTINDNIERK